MSKNKEYKSYNSTPGFHVEEASAILGRVLDECEAEPCEKSVDVLAEEGNYKEKNFPAIRTIIIVIGILVLISPLFLLTPKCSITKSSSSSQGAPVYEIQVTAALPIASVTAMQNGTEIPVIKYSGHTYLVEPTAEGEMLVTVSLINGRTVTKGITISFSDADSPIVTSTESDSAHLYLHVEDHESGVDYEKIQGVDSTGATILPVSVDEKRGVITLDYPSEDLVLSIPDKEGNVLNYQIHISK